MSADSGTHHLGHHARLRLVIVAMLALALILTLEVSPAAAASAKACRVTNTDSGRSFPRLQQAVDAAKPGARLVVKGTCHGGTFIDKDLAIRGVRSERRGKPILDGDEKTRVLTVKPKVEASLRGLVIRDGVAPDGIPSGGGITNKGRLTLRDVVLRDNNVIHLWERHLQPGCPADMGPHPDMGQRGLGSGSALYNTGHATLGGMTRISRNYGCLRNLGVLVMNDSSSIDSCLMYFGADRLWNDGSLVMNDSSSIWGTGGVWNRGDLTLNDASSIHDNLHTSTWRVPGPWGGVVNEGTLTMTGSSSIHHNEAVSFSGVGMAGRGGGIYNAGGGTLVGVNCAPHTYANVYGNTPDDCYIEP